MEGVEHSWLFSEDESMISRDSEAFSYRMRPRFWIWSWDRGSKWLFYTNRPRPVWQLALRMCVPISRSVLRRCLLEDKDLLMPRAFRLEFEEALGVPAMVPVPRDLPAGVRVVGCSVRGMILLESGDFAAMTAVLGRA